MSRDANSLIVVIDDVVNLQMSSVVDQLRVHNQPTNQPTIYFPQLKQIQSERCKQQRKATREAMRLNELDAYVKNN